MLFKKIICALAAAALLCASLTACNQDPDAPTGYVAASGEAARYNLYVPEDWTVDMSTSATSAYCSKEDPSSVSVMAWEIPHSDTTIEDWWEINEEELNSVFSNVEILSTADTTLDGVYAKTYVYNATLGEYSYTIQQTAAIKGYDIYLFTYTSLADTYASHEAEVATMLQYFTFQ